MNLAKWRIKRVAGRWGVFDPGIRWIPLAWFDTHADAVEYLRSVQQWRERGFR
jgi:hypothetical protein